MSNNALPLERHSGVLCPKKRPQARVPSLAETMGSFAGGGEMTLSHERFWFSRHDKATARGRVRQML
jgi:hypothetical protein